MLLGDIQDFWASCYLSYILGAFSTKLFCYNMYIMVQHMIHTTTARYIRLLGISIMYETTCTGVKLILFVDMHLVYCAY